jgi:nucleotide-binding universal stress UspA family protein
VDIGSEPKEYETMLKSLHRIEEKRVSLAKTYLQAVVTGLSRIILNTRSKVLVGKISKSIVDYAESNEIDLILMTPHGRSGPDRCLYGRTADRLLRFSKVPILVVRHDGIIEHKK